MVSFRIGTLVLNGDSQLHVPENGILLLVGPNNSGKSRAILDIDRSQGSDPNGLVIHEVHTKKTQLDDEELRTWLRTEFVAQRQPGLEVVSGGAAETSMELIVQGWQGGRLDGAQPFFMKTLMTHNRLSLIVDGGYIDPRINLPWNPITRAVLDRETEETYDNILNEAFRQHLTIERFAGQVAFRVGRQVRFTSDDRGPTQEYMDAVRALPLLSEQGDGIRSYMGVLMEFLSGRQQVLLIDEPEAFLHPPHARLMGRHLAGLAATKQVIAATHSQDLLMGCLDVPNVAVTVARLTRVGNTTRSAVLRADDLHNLWSDPLLRNSNILSGIFHDAVVVCEGDADCRFYSALWNWRSQQDAAAMPDVLFTSCAGKGRVRKAILSLRAVGVPTVAVVDFDFLFDLKEYGEILPDGPSAKAVHQGLVNGMRNQPRLSSEEALEAFEVFFSPKDRSIGREDLDRFRDNVLPRGRDLVKTSGLEGLDKPTRKYSEKLIAMLGEVGVLVLGSGELESLEPELAGRSSTWVSVAVEKMLNPKVGPSDRTMGFYTQLLQFVRSAVAKESTRVTDGVPRPAPADTNPC